MAHGAGRLARKTASMMGAAAMQAAKRRRSEAEEDNAAVEAVHSGTAAVYNAARYRSPSSKTAANSKRAASLHKNTIRSEENVRSEFMKSSEHAAQAEHRKKERILSFQKKKRQRAIAEKQAERINHRHRGRLCRLAQQHVYRAEKGQGSCEVLLFGA